MKLLECTKKAINFLKEAGETGYNNFELVEKTKMKRRRVYDIIAILKAAGLIEAKRGRKGTRIIWRELSELNDKKNASNENT